ncbi:isochorismatase family protein [Modestobacter sp. VKM Ac-2985]|uniref:isochorismatase family protein n=1 Tax=Modestobacter sp. VKM Ac-2985 TaxID=3004139 RepID=UPI0022ABAFCA|nr:isochorismatase family protein [Modestobacter sp. VKM Ac-2985]MCZ2837325.1 isochorismatase family protein [Modestobacter sp. VKM Ac-2985]
MSADDSENTQQVYARAGFGAAVRRGHRPAVVVVDLTRGFTEPGFDTGADLSYVVADTGALVEAAHAVGAPVVFTAIAYSDAEVDSGAIVWLQKATGMASLREGGDAAALDPRLPRGPRDPLLVKKGASAFAGTHLAAMLSAWQVDTVIVCGATTSGCVRASVVDAVQSGFPVLVPRECVGDRAQAPHDAALFDLQAKYADVVQLTEVLDYLASVETGPAGPATQLAEPALAVAQQAVIR